MAAAKLDTSLPTLLSNLTASLTSAAEPVPSPTNNSKNTADDGGGDNNASSFFSPLPPKDGISLLDVKNELLLSYLQNLVFLILLKLRNNSEKTKKTGSNEEDEGKENVDDVVKKLCELRLYLEKGARPLEGKLKYQIDKVVRAADDAARAEEALKKAGGGGSANAPGGKKNKKKAEGGGGEDESEEDDDEDEDGSDDDDDIDELAYRPNPLAFSRGSNSNDAAGSEADKKRSKRKGDAEPADDAGIYRPPRITATAMPEDLPRHGGGAREERGGPRRAAAIDEFVDEHLSAAPVAQPSIGSNVVDGGRRVKSARDRAAEDERRAYEETNFVRLPAAGKKERAKTAARERRQRSAYGGEEWMELGAGVDRIDRLTRRGERTTGTKGALERSRKRAVEDGPRDSGSGGGAEAGAMFAKRRKVAQRRR
ncbi:putative u3 small nucleolar ribonucleoprotein lcp5 [Diplodia seriata]|uniref:Putative u3 small nucleolar ribonucleoprotein lcp5 n=1 Tax=Diplodia seriata TaxID=420778 RepID=A0A0G2GSV9_9PEZI|nr:putative u3 small nucleolar ribonucleoprotein lcp5 [Diplodia seriata]OMP85089.1 hypothetical protein BK809_0000843 [Diplodia seriata]